MHDPEACGITRIASDTDGYQVVLTRSCVHGFAVTRRITEKWAPSAGEGKPRCDLCGKLISDRGVRLRELYVHGVCDQRARNAERFTRFAERWNAGESVEVLAQHFGIAKRRVPAYAAMIRRNGYVLAQRPHGGGKRKMTAERKEAHDLTMAGTFRQSRYA